MALRKRVQRIAAVAGLVGAVSLGVVSASGQALAETQPAAATHSVTTAKAADTAQAKFFGPYSTYQGCLDAQATVVEQGGVVAWKCGFLSQNPPQYGFYAFV